MTSADPPALETGWGPETPHDDTVLRHGTVAMAATWELVGRVGGARLDGGDRFQAVDLGRPTGLFNSATLLQPLPDDAFAETVARIARFYDARGSGAALLWCPWPTPDLRGHGWELQGHPPLLYRPAGPPPSRDRPDDLTVSTVTTTAALAEWCAVAVEAFPLSEVDTPDRLLDPAVLDDPRFCFVIGHVGQQAMAVGSQVTVCGANVLLLSTVRPEGRGRGYYAALVADRLARSPELPTVTLVSDDSRAALVGRFGFLPVSRFTLWERPRSDAPRVDAVRATDHRPAPAT